MNAAATKPPDLDLPDALRTSADEQRMLLNEPQGILHGRLVRPCFSTSRVTPLVPVARACPPTGRGAIGSNAAGRTDRKGRANHDHLLPFNSRKMVQNADKQRRELVLTSLLD